MKIEPVQISTQQPEKMEGPVQTRKNDLPQNLLIYGGGDDSSWFGNLLYAIGDFLYRLFYGCFGSADNRFDRNNVNYQDKTAWGLDMEKMSLVAPALVLPKDADLEKISVKEIKEFICSGLEADDKFVAGAAIDQLDNPGAHRTFPILLKYLRAILCQKGKISKDKKQEISLRMGEALKVCEQTWVQVAKTVCEELYLGTTNAKAEETLLRLVEGYKSELLFECFERTVKKEGLDYLHWNVTSMVCDKYGRELGLDPVRAQYDHDAYKGHEKEKQAWECAEIVKNLFIEEYKDVNRLVAAVQHKIIEGNIKFFECLVQLVEERHGFGNADAKKYVSDRLFSFDIDTMDPVIKEEAVYLLLQSVEVVV